MHPVRGVSETFPILRGGGRHIPNGGIITAYAPVYYSVKISENFHQKLSTQKVKYHASKMVTYGDAYLPAYS